MGVLVTDRNVQGHHGDTVENGIEQAGLKTATVVLDPGEERIKSEFAGVKRTYLPLHSVLRIDEVKKQGVSKISAFEGAANVAQFPVSMYSSVPGGDAPPKK